MVRRPLISKRRVQISVFPGTNSLRHEGPYFQKTPQTGLFASFCGIRMLRILKNKTQWKNDWVLFFKDTKKMPSSLLF